MPNISPALRKLPSPSEALSPACYCRGTLIRTARGDVAVEDLAEGDLVMTRSGEAEPIRWIGRRSYGGRFLAGRRELSPVRIAAGALADGVPVRDLLVSAKHAMLLQGVLVPAEDLVNGHTVVLEHGLKRVDYYHVELNRHDVILAEGAASETFVDDDSRGRFHNAAEYSGPVDARPGAVLRAPGQPGARAGGNPPRAAGPHSGRGERPRGLSGLPRARPGGDIRRAGCTARTGWNAMADTIERDAYRFIPGPFQVFGGGRGQAWLCNAPHPVRKAGAARRRLSPDRGVHDRRGAAPHRVRRVRTAVPSAVHRRRVHCVQPGVCRHAGAVGDLQKRREPGRPQQRLP